mgnify:CR=1 FL=1
MVIPPSGKETIMNKQKHLNLEARILIETMLNEHHSFKSIACLLYTSDAADEL